MKKIRVKAVNRSEGLAVWFYLTATAMLLALAAMPHR